MLQKKESPELAERPCSVRGIIKKEKSGKAKYFYFRLRVGIIKEIAQNPSGTFIDDLGQEILSFLSGGKGKIICELFLKEGKKKRKFNFTVPADRLAGWIKNPRGTFLEELRNDILKYF